MWRVKYEPGVVRAVSRRNGKTVLEREIRTAGEPAQIRLTADRSEIKSDGTAIRKAGQALGTHDLSGCELYTSAMPCPMCLSAIIWANIKQVYYGNTADDAAAIGFRDAAIYDFINAGLKGDMLALSQHDRELTIGAFKAYQAAQKKLY